MTESKVDGFEEIGKLAVEIVAKRIAMQLAYQMGFIDEEGRSYPSDYYCTGDQEC